jgi:hypothetical protein
MSSLSLEDFSGSKLPQSGFTSSLIKVVHIPDSITTIDDNAFQDCTFLKTVTFGRDSKLRILKGFSCTSIEELSIPDSVEVIGNEAFASCYFLSTITFGIDSNLRFIGSKSFSQTSVRIIHFPRLIKHIESSVFSGCELLREISFHDSFSGNSFHGWIFDGQSPTRSVFISLPTNSLSQTRRFTHCAQYFTLSNNPANEN